MISPVKILIHKNIYIDLIKINRIAYQKTRFAYVLTHRYSTYLYTRSYANTLLQVMIKETNCIKEQIFDYLIKHGYIISMQRRVLIDALCELKEISDIEDFWINLRMQHPISWATVYTNINLLMKAGWLKKDGRSINHSVYRITAQQNIN